MEIIKAFFIFCILNHPYHNLIIFYLINVKYEIFSIYFLKFSEWFYKQFKTCRWGGCLESTTACLACIFNQRKYLQPCIYYSSNECKACIITVGPTICSKLKLWWIISSLFDILTKKVTKQRETENSRVPLRYLPKKLFKPLDFQDYILAIHFQFEIKTPLNRLREEPVVAFFLPPFSTILGLNKINIR